MRAVTYDAYASDNSRLWVGEVPDPKVGPGQVLIEVRAAGVNPVDWKLMAGGLDGMMDVWFPVIPGWDVAGVVRATGPDTPEFAVGDEVLSYARKDVVHGGTFAELVAVNAASVAKKPASLDWNQAAGVPLAGLTAQRSLDRLDVGPDDVLLVHNASGGVGSFAVQIARHRGARVIGTASERNHDYLSELGAEPIAYGDGVVERIKQAAPDGVTAVADFVGGQLETTLAVLAQGGRHVSIADPTVEQKAASGHWIWVRPDGAKLAGLVELPLKVEVAGTFTLEKAGEAFDASREGHTRGKLIITP
ncbi:NADP-dependent oxidoreductase [Actinomadura barringtoniae]|uniref:NADP-dependent oxidoreductase n=1 Tax=Actinomadura barringtoniae TaxID=1427535 RepID=A0A939PN56_9ACTN|nr:NADP-dependent oxidoreductase [Actinomadura barringtoniae]MBO2455715.1 NADP-dependent oxidoreductase [Actinomadura barringtoniae]